ncbi:hypothetical protein NDU88_005930 [Pleurodeles waltl]|uniref:Uncharacterized protein n=1 Tax=Pleurodeles waltl TaxID=8319 RepID=A0AAV7LE53_PLEWA|nr:hypothetical protein NDU88_005930 [Pleurodeles waltl]
MVVLGFRGCLLEQHPFWLEPGRGVAVTDASLCSQALAAVQGGSPPPAPEGLRGGLCASRADRGGLRTRPTVLLCVRLEAVAVTHTAWSLQPGRDGCGPSLRSEALPDERGSLMDEAPASLRWRGHQPGATACLSAP